MAAPGLSELVTTTLFNRTGKLADNITDNNVILRQLNKRGTGLLPFDGGRAIVQELDYAENSNVGWYSGYDSIGISPQENFSAAEFSIKQLAGSLTISGLEQLQNAGKERSISLLAARIENLERSLKNAVDVGLAGDGTAYGGKTIGGLQLLVADSPSTGTVGGINRATYSFWRNAADTGTFTAAGIQASMDTLYLKLVRGNDGPKMILADNTAYSAYMQSMQAIQRVTSEDWASAGFKNLAFMGDIPVFPAGLGGNLPASHMYFLNTDYIHFRPHKERNMTVLDPDRFSTNQDAMVRLVGWAGNLTLSNAMLQGVLK